MGPWHESGGEAVAIVVRRLYATDLKERSRAEHAVLVILKNTSVPLGGSEWLERQDGRGWSPELGAEVAAVRLERLDDGGGSAQPNVQFLEGVVVDQIELNVLIPPALTRGSVFLAEQIQLKALPIFR